MKIYEAIRYAFLTITITASCAQAEYRNQYQKHELTAEKYGKQVAKRDASVFFEQYPIPPNYQDRPKVIYRRISGQKYRSPKPKYGIPRTKHRVVKPSRKVFKKYRKNVSPKYVPANHYKRPPKIRFSHPKASSYSHKPVYGPPKRSPNFYNIPEPVSFGEPPTDYMLDYHFPKTTYGEPPVDSFDGILKSSTSDTFLNSNTFSDPIDLDSQDFTGHAFKPWKYNQLDDFDTNFAPSVRRPTYAKPKPEYENPTGTEDDINPYADRLKYEKEAKMDAYNRIKKRQQITDTTKVMNRPWTTSKLNGRKRPESQMVVGGQYAEPPAKYVHKFTPSASTMSDDEDFDPHEQAVDPDVVSSATNSPYVNYKNSNVAFSPQNLNDAFSIVV